MWSAPPRHLCATLGALPPHSRGDRPHFPYRYRTGNAKPGIHQVRELLGFVCRGVWRRNAKGRVVRSLPPPFRTHDRAWPDAGMMISHRLNGQLSQLPQHLTSILHLHSFTCIFIHSSAYTVHSFIHINGSSIHLHNYTPPPQKGRLKKASEKTYRYLHFHLPNADMSLSYP